MISICKWCKNPFKHIARKHFCNKCVDIYGRHISRKYFLMFIKARPVKCRSCGITFKSHRKNAKFCNKCSSVKNAVKFWQIDNPEKNRKKQRKYRKNNLELCRKRTRENQRLYWDKIYFNGLRFKRLRKDNYTCQWCGKDISKKKSGVVHHVDHDKKNNVMENLISLCNKCHVTYHNKFRKRKNGRFI